MHPPILISFDFRSIDVHENWWIVYIKHKKYRAFSNFNISSMRIVCRKHKKYPSILIFGSKEGDVHKRRRYRAILISRDEIGIYIDKLRIVISQSICIDREFAEFRVKRIARSIINYSFESQPMARNINIHNWKAVAAVDASRVPRIYRYR